MCVVSHFCAEQVRCRFHFDRNGQSSSSRLEPFNGAKQLWRLTPQAFANCRPLEGKHKTRRGNYCFFPGEACQRDSAAFVHEHMVHGCSWYSLTSEEIHKIFKLLSVEYVEWSYD